MNTLPCLAFIDGLGGPELLMVAFIALVLFGGKNLPSLARTMGKTMREFKKASSEVEREIRKAIDETPDPDVPAKPVATVPQYHAMPASAPVPSPYTEYPSEGSLPAEAASSQPEGSGSSGPGPVDSSVEPALTPATTPDAPGTPSAKTPPAQSPIQPSEISRHRIEPNDV